MYMKPLLETPLPDRLYRGKVRDTYDLGDGLLLMVATDRISAFDVVLQDGITDKGRVLSRMSQFWFEQTEDIACHKGARSCFFHSSNHLK